ncbi:MAG: hypothetical protein C0507_01915 [Cyanobacteria bacterium PR.3.49]|nr:hypothetical protein [Cyanobacteria bacterium PR.3.49]
MNTLDRKAGASVGSLANACIPAAEAASIANNAMFFTTRRAIIASLIACTAVAHKCNYVAVRLENGQGKPQTCGAMNPEFAALEPVTICA